jgi:hypothetical protein
MAAATRAHVRRRSACHIAKMFPATISSRALRRVCSLLETAGMILLYSALIVSAIAVRYVEESLETVAVIFVVALAAGHVGLALLAYARPRTTKTAAQKLASDGRRPVLYLRSFSQDFHGPFGEHFRVKRSGPTSRRWRKI